MNNEDQLPEEFEGTEEEKLRMENDILWLRVQAELGGIYKFKIGEPFNSLEVEHKMLQNLIKFREQFASPTISVRERLEFPEFLPSAALSDEELAAEWARVNALYESKGLGIEFLAYYQLHVRYDFMAIEAMDKSVLPIPGCFIRYEHYHPNHDFDQRNRTEEFMKSFFEGRLNEAVLAPEIVVPEEGRQIPLEEVQGLLHRFHGLFAELKDWNPIDLYIAKTNAQTDEEMGESGERLGFTEGLVRYTVVLADSTEQTVEGPFKLYMSLASELWMVTYFHVHGFSWK